MPRERADRTVRSDTDDDPEPECDTATVSSACFAPAAELAADVAAL